MPREGLSRKRWKQPQRALSFWARRRISVHHLWRGGKTDQPEMFESLASCFAFRRSASLIKK